MLLLEILKGIGLLSVIVAALAVPFFVALASAFVNMERFAFMAFGDACGIDDGF